MALNVQKASAVSPEILLACRADTNVGRLRWILGAHGIREHVTLPTLHKQGSSSLGPFVGVQRILIKNTNELIFAQIRPLMENLYVSFFFVNE